MNIQTFFTVTKIIIRTTVHYAQFAIDAYSMVAAETNIMVSHWTKSRHNHQEPIIIEIVQSKYPAICLQWTENKSYY